MDLVALEDLEPGWRCLVNTDTATRLRTETLHRSRGCRFGFVYSNTINMSEKYMVKWFIATLTFSKTFVAWRTVSTVDGGSPITLFLQGLIK